MTACRRARTARIAASLPEAWQVAYEIAKRAGGDPGFPGLYGPATPPAPVAPAPARAPRNRRLGGGGAGRARGVGRGAGATLQAGRRRDRDPPRRRRQSPRSKRPSTGARDLSARDQCVGIALADQHLPPRDAGKLSKAMLDRGAQAEAMTARRLPRAASPIAQRRRAVYRALAARIRRLHHAVRAPAPRRSASARPAIRCSWFRARCSAFRRSRCRCSRTAACRSGFSCWASPTATPTCSPPPAPCWTWWETGEAPRPRIPRPRRASPLPAGPLPPLPIVLHDGERAGVRGRC